MVDCIGLCELLVGQQTGAGSLRRVARECGSSHAALCYYRILHAFLDAHLAHTISTFRFSIRSLSPNSVPPYRSLPAKTHVRTWEHCQREFFSARRGPSPCEEHRRWETTRPQQRTARARRSTAERMRLIGERLRTALKANARNIGDRQTADPLITQSGHDASQPPRADHRLRTLTWSLLPFRHSQPLVALLVISVAHTKHDPGLALCHAPQSSTHVAKEP